MFFTLGPAQQNFWNSEAMDPGEAYFVLTTTSSVEKSNDPFLVKVR
jgi:hypothetical protein